MNRRAGYESSAWGEWTMMGGQMLIQPVLGSGTTAYFAYLQKNCIALGGSGFGDAFQSDGDSFVLDERLLKLGMIWQWRANKGAAYAEDMGTFGDAMAKAQGTDSPAPIMIGRRVMVQTINATYPYPLTGP
jgi:hypothetical protein